MSQNKQKVLNKFQAAIVEALFMFLFMKSAMSFGALEFPSLKHLLFNFLVWTIYGFMNTDYLRPWLEKRYKKQTTYSIKAGTQ